MATRYPNKGKGSKWTVKELENISDLWKGDVINDGGGLSGEVRVNKEGHVSIKFDYRFRFEKKVHKFYCGSFPNTSMREIRNARDNAKAVLNRGINPKEQKKAQRIEEQNAVKEVIKREAERQARDLCVDDLFKAWTTLDSGVLRKDGNVALRRSYNKHIKPRIGQMKIQAITDNDLLKMLKSIKGEAKDPTDIQRAFNRTVDIVYGEIKQMFTWAERRQPWRRLMAEGNPAVMLDSKQIKKLQDVDYKAERERVLSGDEIRELASILGMNKNDYSPCPDFKNPTLHFRGQCAVWICLGTMCRIGELMLSEWSHVDFEHAQWFIPAANTKGARGHQHDLTVSLSPFVVAQFRALHAVTGHLKHCFPSRDGMGSLDRNALSKLIGDRQCRFMGRKNKTKRRVNNNTLVLSGGENGKWTLHDLRRTGATMMQMLGIPPDIINLCQNHSLNWGVKVSKNYLHYDYAKEKAAAWLRWGERIEEILRGEV